MTQYDFITRRIKEPHQPWRSMHESEYIEDKPADNVVQLFK